MAVESIGQIGESFDLDDDAQKSVDELQRLFELLDEMCREAGLRNRRESARGESYSIAENAIAEYTAWYHMPWEDY